MQDIEPGNDLGRWGATPHGVALGLAHALAGTLRVARALTSSGRAIDLAGLENPVGLLCAKSLDLPPEQGRQMRLVLIALRQEIEAMAATLRSGPGGARSPP